MSRKGLQASRRGWRPSSPVLECRTMPSSRTRKRRRRPSSIPRPGCRSSRPSPRELPVVHNQAYRPTISGAFLFLILFACLIWKHDPAWSAYILSVLGADDIRLARRGRGGDVFRRLLRFQVHEKINGQVREMPEGWQVIASIAAGFSPPGHVEAMDMLLFKIEKKVDRSEWARSTAGG